MIIQKTVCDKCGVEKKETNHWFKVAIDKYGDLVIMSSASSRLLNTGEPSLVRRDVCGENCALSFATRWLETGSLTE